MHGVSFHSDYGNVCFGCFEDLTRKVTAEQVQAFLDGESPDSNVEKLREMLLQRSLEGIKEYGVTTDREDMTELEWRYEHLHELLDAAVYNMKLIRKLEAKNALDRAMEIERGKA